jgi:GDPmannose 4,6-dehydratase
MKKAFITGITGQDGAYLAQILLEAGYKVFGGIRRTSTHNLWRLERLGIAREVELVNFELLESSNIQKVISQIQPDEFYNLAAQSFVGVSFEQPLYTANASGLSVMTILDALKTYSPHTKFYQASTSEMFGKVQEIPQTETTPFHPRSPYGVAKLFAHWATINYRESYNMFASTGILFNHESPLRGEEFVTRKITKGLVAIKRGELDVLELGNLDAKRDWGYAKDYCEGIYKILQHHEPQDFVLATGETHSIKEFIQLCCELLEMKVEFIGEGLDAKVVDVTKNKVIIKVNEKFYRPCEVDVLLGSCQKAREILNWSPQTNYQMLAEIMIREEA